VKKTGLRGGRLWWRAWTGENWEFGQNRRDLLLDNIFWGKPVCFGGWGVLRGSGGDDRRNGGVCQFLKKESFSQKPLGVLLGIVFGWMGWIEKRRFVFLENGGFVVFLPRRFKLLFKHKCK
jgi:hypothetical protein